jgi:hypothetical protein
MHMTACTAAAPEKRIHTLEPAADGGCISRETFNPSDNPNKGSRIIPWPPANQGLQWRYLSPTPCARKFCGIETRLYCLVVHRNGSGSERL